MEAVVKFIPVSRMERWLSYVVSAVPCFFLSFSAVMKVVKPPGFEEGFASVGWPVELATPLGILELGCVVVYLVPRTAILGAILITAYMGGAVATHLRIADAFIIQICLGALAWLGIWLRDLRLRDLVPIVK